MKMHKMIVYIGVERGCCFCFFVHFKTLYFHTTTISNKQREKGEKRRKTVNTVPASFSCKATSIHRSSLNRKYIFKDANT